MNIALTLRKGQPLYQRRFRSLAEVGFWVDITIIPAPRWFPVMLYRLRSGVQPVFSCVTLVEVKRKEGDDLTSIHITNYNIIFITANHFSPYFFLDVLIL